MDGAHTRWTVFILKGIRHCIHHVRHININALQRQQGVERNIITTGHDFKTKLSPTWGHEDVLVPRELVETGEPVGQVKFLFPSCQAGMQKP